MSISDKFFRVNGMQIIVDYQGLPESVERDMKSICNCKWLTMKQKISLLDKTRKNYLTQLAEKHNISDRNHY